MNPFSHIKVASCSDMGCKRTNNEDAFGAFPDAGVFCVADGMGGGDDGEFASAETVAAVSRVCARAPVSGGCGRPAAVMAMEISAALNGVSASVVRHVAENGLKFCGSTFVGVLFDSTAPDAAVALHAGDSRLYRYRDGVLTRLTRDHSVAELVGRPDEKSLDVRFRSMIVRAVGVQSTVELERTTFDVCPGDRIFMCSDGLTRMASEEDLSDILADEPSADAAVEKMVEAAKRGGGDDNITVVLIDVGELPAPLPAMQDNADATLLGGQTIFSSNIPLAQSRRYSRRRWLALLAVALSVAVVAFLLLAWTSRLAARRNEAAGATSVERLAAVCDQDTIRSFVRVVRLLDRHGVSDGFEDRARLLSETATSEAASRLARDVLSAVKAGVDYARDCLESKEAAPDRRTERLRRLFVSLSPDIDGDPEDPRTQARCAAIIREVAGWD